ncbi:MAG: HEAT repeat domain-containing protein [Elusimicrobia bacterium]|nr:HEAT repeat domain-containing protein [Elusimicrobiota bacterium]
MPDIDEHSPELLAKKTAASAFIASLMASAKTAGLYKQGHPTIMAISDRIVALLLKTLGQETTLTLEVKAKTVAIDDSDLEATPEITAFAAALHTLGIGQLLFTNRMTKEGMYEFFRVLISKPEGTSSLTDLQKATQAIRIDGLQMVFILSFVVTGESEKKEQPPEQLSEEQIAAFLKAETLPDYITLLVKQSEPLHGKEAEAVTGLLDSLLYREISADAFEAAMPWSLYDPRIQQRWEVFKSKLAFQPKARGAARQKWSRAGIISWSAVFEDWDLAALKDHHVHEKKDALRWSLTRVTAIMDKAASPAHQKYALLAYTRLLKEFGHDGDIATMLAEYDRWKVMAASEALASLYGELQKQIKEKVLTPSMIEQFVSQLAKVSESSPQFEKMVDFALYFGEPIVPPILENLRAVQDKDHRRKVCALLVGLGKALGDKTLLPALKDEDWFLVSNVLDVLSELGDAKNTRHAGPLLKHGNRKVREAAAKFLLKFGGEAAVEALTDFIAEGRHPEEIPKAVISLSQLNQPGLDRKLVAAFRKTQCYESKVAIARALSRFGGPAAVELLVETARRSWYEILSGLNKELREAAKHSLEQLRKEGHA